MGNAVGMRSSERPTSGIAADPTSKQLKHSANDTKRTLQIATPLQYFLVESKGIKPELGARRRDLHCP